MKLNRTGSIWNRDERNKINDNWDKLERNVKRIEKTTSDLILESGGSSNLEVVQARGGKPVLNDRLNNVDTQLAKTESLTRDLQTSKVGRSQFESELNGIRDSIDDIIVTPAEGISEQEIIDARMGKGSLGTNIREISNNQETSLSNKIYNGNFIENSLDGYSFFFGTGQLSRNVPGYNRDDLLILTSSGSGHDYFGATAAFKLADSIPETDVWYIKARARASGETVARIRTGFRGSSGILDGDINNIEPNKWYDISFRFDPKTQNHSMSGEFRASLFFTYQTGTQSGKVAEVDNWLAINLTETFGAGKEPTKEQMDNFLSYFPDKYFGANDVGSLASANSNRLTNVEKEVEDKLNDFEGYIENANKSLINNIVDNGDFSNTGGGKWRTQNSTWRIENNTMTLIGAGNNSMPGVFQNIGVSFKQGNKIYVRADLTPKNDDFTRLALMAYASSGGDSIKYFYIDDAQKGVRKTHSNVFELANAGNGDLTIQIRAQYSSASSSMGKEVDINNVLVIDLTETFGPGNEPTAEQIDDVINALPNKWFETSPRFDELQKSMMTYVFKNKSKGGGSLKRPIICITIDDGTHTDYSKFYQKMKERGMTGTSYIIGSRIGNKGYLTEEQLKEMRLNGWGTECHTYSHLRLAELTEQEVRDEITLNNQAFENMGMPIPKHHALPYGSVNAMVRNTVGEYRETVRNISGGSNDTYNDWGNINFKSLNSINIDTTNTQGIKDGIDRGIDNNGIIILFGHEVGDSQYQTPEATLDWLLDYIEGKGLPTYTIDEMYRQVLEYQRQL